MTQFLTEADEEFREATRYYEREARGLGLAFVIAVHRAVGELQLHPQSCPEVRPGLRKKIIKRFPYSLIFSLDADALILVAVAHQKQRPNYWKARIGGENG